MKELRTLLPTAVMLAAVAGEAQAQRRVTGTVTGEGTTPLQAASVQVVGTTTGTYTNEAGRFSLQVPNGTQTIRVRRIGYRAQTVTLAAGQSEVAVTLQRDVLQLETQVVTGVATTISRRNAANDVAQVRGDELTRVAVPTVDNALQGKIAGANVTTNSGAPGGGAQFRIRGANSVLGNTDPLLIVDGVIISNDVIQPGTNAVLGASAGSNSSTQDNGVNRIADLNPNDVENIEVLKGASASQIYGSRASNGVIIITTKRGSAGRPQFAVTQRVGAYSILRKLPVRRFTLPEALEDGVEVRGLDSATVSENYARCSGFCDHQDELFGQSPVSYESNLSVRGGNQSAQYFISGLAKRDGGIATNTGYDKQSLRANLNTTLGERLTAQVNTQLIHSRAQRGFSNNDNANVTPYFVFPATPSYFDLRPQGGLYPANPFTASNPLQTFALSRTPEDVFRLLGSVSADYTLLTTARNTLSLRATGGVDQFNQQNNVVTPRTLQFEPADRLPGTATEQAGTNVYGNTGLVLTHTFHPGPVGQFTTSGGTQYEYRSQRTSNVVSRDVLLGQENIQNASVTEAFDFRLRQRDQAFFAQEEFLGFDERLLLQAGVRAQRSTVNGDAQKYYVFPKFAASYRIPGLPKAINEAKLRAAYGAAGNPPLITAQYTPLLTGVYNGNIGVQAGTRFGNPNIRPEIQRELEGGVDLAFLNQRASLGVTGYSRTISDLLLRPSLAPSLGVTQVDINGGRMRNQGLEINAGGALVQTAAATWNSRLIYARNVNKILSLPASIGRVSCLDAAGTALEVDPNKCPIGFTGGAAGAYGFTYGQGQVQEGASVTQVVGYDSLSNGVRYVRRYGDTEPAFTMGFSNDFTYRGVRLYGLLDWRRKFSIVNLTQSTFDDAGTWGDTAGTNRREEAIGTGKLSPYIQDGSFLALREVTLSYTLPTSLTGRYLRGGNSVSLELSGRNLKYWTKYEGLTPEVSNFGNSNVVRNQDLAPFPQSRSYFVSVNVGF